MKNAIADAVRKTGGQVGHPDTNADTDGTGDGEHDVGEDEALEAEVGLGDVETKTEGHDCFVDNDSYEDRDELGGVILQSNCNP